MTPPAANLSTSVSTDRVGLSSDQPREARVVAIIMDGNGRWAEAHRTTVAEGHRAGARALRRTVEAAIDLGIETLVVYAFSTENWTRPTDEIADLMVLLSETIDEERRAEAQVQKLTDDHVKRIDELLKHKEAEIMEV